ncbi:EamA family transporter [Actinophytocola sp.]|uniref:EamA family transporter n=1 Tax=Actinophytocola sp. TaxID=1872138 RepID=UPI002ED4B94E
MTGVLLALASAVAYGLADFVGGLLSRRAHFGTIAFVGQLAGLVFALGAAPFVAADVTYGDLGWGALSGAGTGVGMLFLYRGLARGDMSVVVPVSAVGGVALPVIVSVAVLGERPTALAWAGTIVAVPALWLVGRADGGGKPAALGDALIASVGFAVQYLALAQAHSGLWPIVAGRVVAALIVLPTARRRIPARIGVGAAACGVTAAGALVCYLLATRQTLDVVAVVLSSLYPAIPALLGITVLRERLSTWQTVGLAAAGISIGLLAVG